MMPPYDLRLLSHKPAKFDLPKHSPDVGLAANESRVSTLLSWFSSKWNLLSAKGSEQISTCNQTDPAVSG